MAGAPRAGGSILVSQTLPNPTQDYGQYTQTSLSAHPLREQHGQGEPGNP